jgi:hypothetical protein
MLNQIAKEISSKLVSGTSYRDLLRKIAPKPRTRILPFFSKKTRKQECFIWGEIILHGRGVLERIEVRHETMKQSLMLFVEIYPRERSPMSILAVEYYNSAL